MPQAASILRFRDYTQDTYAWARTYTLGRTLLNERPARRTGLYLHNTHKHNRRTSMPSAGLEPAIPTIKQLYALTLDRKDTGIGPQPCYHKGIRLWRFIKLRNVTTVTENTQQVPPKYKDLLRTAVLRRGVNVPPGGTWSIITPCMIYISYVIKRSSNAPRLKRLYNFLFTWN
jgi:hypothetical protein